MGKNNTNDKKKELTQEDITRLVAGKRYVFYTSLRSEPANEYRQFYHEAKDALGKYKARFAASKDKNGERTFGPGIQEAITFLKNSAEFEREKELQFFKNFTTAHPEVKELFNISVEDVLNDYDGFLININRALKNTQQLQKEVEFEINRIKENRKFDNEYEQKKKAGKKNASHDEFIKQLQDERERKKDKMNDLFFMKANGIDAFQSIFRNTGHMSVLSNVIIEKFGDKIFDKNLKLNERQLSALIASLTMKANELFCASVKLPSNRTHVQTIANEIVNNKEFQKYTEILLNAPDLDQVMSSIMEQYSIKSTKVKEIADMNDRIKYLKNNLYRNWKSLQNNGKTNLTFNNWLKQMNLSEDKLKKMIMASEAIAAQCYYVGEDLSLLDLIANHIRGVLGGQKNPTDDIEAGALVVNFDLDQKKLDELENQLWEIQSTAFNQDVDKTTDLASYQNNINALRTARNKQQTILEQFLKENKISQDGLKYLLKHINIHSTVKGYEAAGTSNFISEGGFGGAAFGSTLYSELEIIKDMVDAGGLKMQFDVEDLYVAMINCGNLMIGNEINLKPTLQTYFSAFMGMFMFNDASLFAEDVKNWLAREQIKPMNVQDLHLYQLNGIVVPSSYILQKTYDAMSTLSNMNSKYRGVKAVFTTYNKEPIKGDWPKTSATAISETKLERMHFIAGFLDLLEGIQLRLSQL